VYLHGQEKLLRSHIHVLSPVYQELGKRRVLWQNEWVAAHAAQLQSSQAELTEKREVHLSQFAQEQSV
tara:strand:+ start:1890 stop:2093 length:204 start_codon:yes stop_codon:yes gene_type:complete